MCIQNAYKLVQRIVFWASKLSHFALEECFTWAKILAYLILLG